MYKGTRKTLPICIYPIKYLNEPLLPYEYLLDNTVRLVSTSSILIGFPFLWIALLLTQLHQKLRHFVQFFYYVKKKRQ